MELQERHEHWEVGQKQTYKAEREEGPEEVGNIREKLCNDNARNSNNKRDNTGPNRDNVGHAVLIALGPGLRGRCHLRRRKL